MGASALEADRKRQTDCQQQPVHDTLRPIDTPAATRRQLRTATTPRKQDPQAEKRGRRPDRAAPRRP
eukprot:606720-Lingulodinium_polyedra.AAC.1